MKDRFSFFLGTPHRFLATFTVLALVAVFLSELSPLLGPAFVIITAIVFVGIHMILGMGRT